MRPDQDTAMHPGAVSHGGRVAVRYKLAARGHWT